MTLVSGESCGRAGGTEWEAADGAGRDEMVELRRDDVLPGASGSQRLMCRRVEEGLHEV